MTSLLKLPDTVVRRWAVCGAAGGSPRRCLFDVSDMPGYLSLDAQQLLQRGGTRTAEFEWVCCGAGDGCELVTDDAAREAARNGLPERQGIANLGGRTE